MVIRLGWNNFIIIKINNQEQINIIEIQIQQQKKFSKDLAFNSRIYGIKGEKNETQKRISIYIQEKE